MKKSTAFGFALALMASPVLADGGRLVIADPFEITANWAMYSVDAYTGARVGCFEGLTSEGRVKPGDTLISRSIIGGEFTTEFLTETKVGPHIATQNRVSGKCWIYSLTTIGLDPTDPFQTGFTLSDTWGG